MKRSTPSLRASHVNSGTAVDPTELPWPDTSGRVLRHPTLHLEADPRGEMTHYGGLVLAQQFVRRFRVAPRLDDALHRLKMHLPYHECDHVRALMYTLYAGGTCLEDQAALQGSEAVRRLVGACRLPDPTTAGDFLRRFRAVDVEALGGVIDAVEAEVWQRLPRRTRRRRRKRELALVDLDGHVKPLYGVQKEGADFTHDGRWAYQPLVVSLAGTGECLRVVNRPGNVRSSDGAAAAVRAVLPRVQRHVENAIVRADSDFDRADLYQAVGAAGAYFAVVARVHANRAALAQALPEDAWQPYVPPAHRAAPRERRRGRTPNWQRAQVEARGWRSLHTRGQWIAEVPYQPAGLDAPCRRIIRRILIEEREGQPPLFEHYRYRLVLTNLPATHSVRQIVDLTYQRGDQENVIEQLGTGIAGWRMPVAEFVGNAAWLEIARLAWNVGKWIAQLALPAEVVRWEWKRFRRHFVYLAAKGLRLGRRIVVRLDGSHQMLPELLAAHARLQL